MRHVSDRVNQEVRLLTASDGVRIAFARTGTGPPLVRAAHWLSHLEFDWESLVWSDFLTELATRRTLVRYDERGTGLSDRDVADLSFEAMVGDLESVVDELGLERFALLGMSQGAAISIAYAVRHPERVAAMVLCGGYARGHAHRGRTPEQQRDAELLLQLIRVGWGTPNPKFRRVFATMFLGDSTPARYEAFDELQRVSATPDAAYRLRSMFAGIDVTPICGQVRTPTLVMHVRDDGVVPFEEGRLLAALIPRSRFVSLDGTSHILVPGSPAWERFFQELRGFLESVASDDDGAAVPGTARPSGLADPALESLSRREREVMRLVADGRTNAEIASALGISPRTIERHLSNVYAKLGLEGKAARAAAAARVSRSTQG
jgi:pimeloyl-ACP methyl ester carboxylesterase/DNA-binding CsgD family transcriptional regulator